MSGRSTSSPDVDTGAHPADLFAGTVVVVAPHMDDEVLACGGLVARLPDKARIHFVFATDGMRSPAPVLPWRDATRPDLGALREDESRRAARILGLPEGNTHFLRLPEAELPRHEGDLRRRLDERFRDLDPDHVLVPFRYDRHPDHLAVRRAVVEARRAEVTRAMITEYFVYYRWRLLPKGDVRRYVRPEHLIRVDIDAVAGLKREALDCFTTQTTRFFDWQTRPILRPELLDEECVGPELFVRCDIDVPDGRLFTGLVPWIRIAHRLEPKLVRWKYLVKSSLTRGAGRLG
ncbi:MAG: PIG-L family deacetylase [Gemmatimonadota bacterium]